MNRKYEIKPEWTQQALVVFGGLIAIGVVILQALISAPSLDLPLQVSILSFAIAMPLLAIMVLVNHAQASYRYASYPRYLSLAIMLGQGGASGRVAGDLVPDRCGAMREDLIGFPVAVDVLEISRLVIRARVDNLLGPVAGTTQAVAVPPHARAEPTA